MYNLEIWDIKTKKYNNFQEVKVMKKYELAMGIEMETNVAGKKLYRIIAIRDFGKVKAGAIGGYVESEACLSHEDDCWVADDAGTTACIGDMFVDFNDIRYDIDNDVPEPKFEEWYWTSLERAELGIKYMNYESFCKGAPDPVPPESMNEILTLRKKLNDIRMQLFRASSEYRDEKLPNYM